MACSHNFNYLFKRDNEAREVLYMGNEWYILNETMRDVAKNATSDRYQTLNNGYQFLRCSSERSIKNSRFDRLDMIRRIADRPCICSRASQ